MSDYAIYKYIRLSLDDTNTGSMSIENQRTIIDKYIDGLEIPDAQITEIVDNGYSGTNFERPGISELLELVRSGKVNCIIVKDFSRFGRNAIETGYFIERIFPLFRVRFISISDNFDSADHEGDTGGMEIAFKFLIHEYYSKDLSQKIKTAKQAKMKRGESVTKNCVHGYRKAGTKLEIDEATADTVRLIFQLYANNTSIANIQRQLYKEKHLTPAEYKKTTKNINKPENLTCVWKKAQILKILSDEQYIGTYTAGKTQMQEIGSNRSRQVSPSEWIRIPDHHPAVIYKTIFDTVQARINEKKEPSQKTRTWKRYDEYRTSPLIGKVICGGGGHKLHLSSTKKTTFHCYFARTIYDIACHKLKIPAAELEATVFEIISKQALIILNADLGSASLHEVKLEQQSEYEKQIKGLHDKKQDLYERLLLGEINENEYKTAKSVLDEKLNHFKHTLAILKKEVKQRTAILETRQTAEQINTENTLTKPLADLLIEQIKVHPDTEIEIKWKASCFTDEIMMA